jgi:DNA invertase Pin-like site-specific DNA recombinase
MKAVGYIRVSTDAQADKGASLENQVARIQEYASKKGFILENIFEDAGYSGKNTKRPGFQDMFNRVRKGGVTAVIVWHSTRFARNLKDNIVHLYELEKLKVKFYSVEEPEMSGTSGKAMRNLMAVFAEYQSDLTGDQVRSVKGNLKRNKKVYSGFAPLGYKHYNGDLVETAEMEIVKEIFDLRHNGYSYDKIAKQLNNKNLKGNKGGKFYPITIHKVIKNKIYETQGYSIN